MTPARPRTWLRPNLVALTAAGLLLAAATTAAAHDELVGSDPPAGAALDTGPTTVRLDFSADVMALGAAVVVADDAGTAYQQGSPELDGSSVTVPVDPDLPDGGYEIRWRVVSSDGHPITGVVPFTVGDPSAAVPGTTAPGTTAPAPSPSTRSPGTASVTSPTAAPTGSPTPASTAGVDAAPTGTTGTAGTSPWRTTAVGVGGAALALGLLLAVTRLRRHRRRPDVTAP